MISITHAGRTYTNFTIAELLEAGVPQGVVNSALISRAQEQVASQASTLRAAVVSTDPAKLQEYAIKEKIALDPEAATPAEIALLTGEAQARGLTLEALLALITARASALRQVALSIAVWEAQAKATIAALDADSPSAPADLEVAIATNAQAGTALLALAGAGQ